MLSGTTIKAVISYVTDYISKPILKTHQIFATAYNVFDKNSKLDDDNPSCTDDAQKLILKTVNALSSKMEIGSTMAMLYLLQNPDHYVSHQFIPFWWKSFVNNVRSYDSNNPALDLKNQETNQKIDTVFENENKMNVDNPNLFFGEGNHINRNIYTDNALDKEIISDDEY